MASRKVAVICYGQRREFPSRKKAMDFFKEGILCCDGAERDRYVSIYFQLEAGATLATDEIY
jgi:hypothetical protein